MALTSHYFLFASFSMTLSRCAHKYVVEAAGLHRFHSSLLITQGWFHRCAYCSVLSHQCQVNNFARKRKRKQSREDIFFFFLLTWSPEGRCCWGPSYLAAEQTPEWSAHPRCLEQGHGWDCVPLSGCFCSGCWQTGGIRCGGCAAGAAEAVAWTDCGGWQPLQTDNESGTTF